jgi:cell division septation protein DedD
MSLAPTPTQFELFPSASARRSHAARTGFQFRDICISLDNCIIGCVGLILTLVFFYSLGVEKGRRVVYRQVKIAPKNHPLLSTKNGIMPASLGENNRRPEARTTVRPVDPGSMVENQMKRLEPVVQPANVLPVQPSAIEQAPKREILENLYTIQVASYKASHDAQKEAMRLKQKGHDSFVIPKGSYTILCIGKFVEKAQAQRASKTLKGKYSDLLVRRM